MSETTLQRGAGLLLPIYALPSPFGVGTLGKCAYEFVDFLSGADQKYWQILPVGPTTYGDSPYQSYSAFAGNPYFIDLEMLVQEGLLKQEEIDRLSWGDHPSYVSYDLLFQNRPQVLKLAFGRSRHKETEAYGKFCEENSFWLEGYALFMACKEHFNYVAWYEWEEELKFRKPEALKKYGELLCESVEYHKFCQYQFFRQWETLKAYANERNVELIGDIPIYVAPDSADIWEHPEYFQLDETLTPTKVAGVPPDAFSADGQLWGNPLYDWDAIEKTDFLWWRERMKASAKLYDCLRIDHFIGVVRYYSVPYGASNAKEGEWVWGPGKKLIQALKEEAGSTKIIAEDLGIVIPEVVELMEEEGLPGMKIIEFAYGGDNANPHLPHNYTPNSIVYGGTHDNETLAGHFHGKSGWEVEYAMEYMGIKEPDRMIDRIFRTAYQSVASVAIFQVQDVLHLGNEARTNEPSTTGNNWKWRLHPGQLTYQEQGYLKRLVWVFRR